MFPPAVVDQFASLWARCSPTDGRSRWLFVSPAVLLRLRSGFDYPQPPQTLAPVIQDEVYPIGREILRNAFRHARAKKIEVEIRYDDRLLRLRIRDDGIGIDPKVLDEKACAGHGACPESANARNLFGRNWISGAKRARARRSNSLHPHRSLTRTPLTLAYLDCSAKLRGLMPSDAGVIRILTVDDHALLRKGIAALVNAEPDMKLVAEASNGAAAITEFKKHRPDVTLMDLQMPEMSGIEATIAVRGDFPNARIIILTTYPGDAQVVRALKAGARAYLSKDQVNTDL